MRDSPDDPAYDKFFDISKVLQAPPGQCKGYERELSDFHRGDLPVGGTLVQLRHLLTRDLTVSGGTATGAATIQNTLSIITDALRPLSACLAAGARLIPDLRGNMVVVRTDLNSQPVWRPEVYTQTDTASPTWDQVVVKPYLASQQILVSVQLFEQAATLGGGLDTFLKNLLLKALGSLLDTAAFSGAGLSSNQPAGILTFPVNAPGANDPTKLSPGFAWSGAPTWAEVVGLETSVATQNAPKDGTYAYIQSPTTRGLLKTSPVSGSYPVFICTPEDKINGSPAFATSNIPDNTLVFGRWSECLICMWRGAVDVISNPYTHADQNCQLITLNSLVDVAFLHANAFAVGQ
jgi:HK97 family phage major capsid protein